MLFLIRMALGFVLLGALAYAVFFVPLSDKPLAKHVQEVWSADVVQEKADLVRDGVRDKVEPKLRDARDRAVQEMADVDRAP